MMEVVVWEWDASRGDEEGRCWGGEKRGREGWKRRRCGAGGIAPCNPHRKESGASGPLRFAIAARAIARGRKWKLARRVNRRALGRGEPVASAPLHQGSALRAGDDASRRPFHGSGTVIPGVDGRRRSLLLGHRACRRAGNLGGTAQGRGHLPRDNVTPVPPAQADL